MRRFIFERGEELESGTITYDVRRKGEPKHESVGVWWSRYTQQARCCKCSSALQGMSASCEHARALKYHLMKQVKRESGAQALNSKRIKLAAYRALLEAARPKKRRVIDVYKDTAVRYQRIEPLYIDAVTLLGRMAGKRALSGADRRLIKKAMDDCAGALDGRFEVVRTSAPFGWSLRPKSD